MTLRLVADNGEAIREQTIRDELVSLNLEGAQTLVTIALGDGFSSISVLGEPMGLYSLMGIFEAAKFETMSDLLEGE